MEDKVFEGNFLQMLVEEIDGRILAPSEETEGIVNFKEVSNFEDIDLSHVNTKKPLKEVAFPQNDEILRYGGEWIGKVPSGGKKLVLGARPCSARALNMLDEIFTAKSEEYPDPYYEKRRDEMIIIGLACNEAGRNCFCTSLGGNPHGTEGSDMLVTDLGGKHHVQILSEKGEKLIFELDRLRDEKREESEKRQELEEEAIKSIGRKIEDAENLPVELENVFEDNYWKKIAVPCIGCGICTYLCPTCHCFDITDEGEEKGRRIKSWDSCQYPIFTLETSSHNPRREKYERLRNRFYDKYRYKPAGKGQIFCVGCGRCVDECPAGIDIIDVMNGVHELEG